MKNMSAIIKFIYAMSLILFIANEHYRELICKTDDNCPRRGTNKYFIHKCIDYRCQWIPR
ncbi:putative Late nodulin [Medicago truncatula]|uniref:Nodule Cysteine-Rich (NCR) secreted peptide n=1 Tax=Medicago truncatula TaxID=3880 RepID=G7I4S7_MEDTR|nr:Nodule Cysteine-Rich (NCR) secreted peptide [Medicago truncatula]RHN80349.1 putative Late nodulin [Medicago truncatula]